MRLSRYRSREGSKSNDWWSYNKRKGHTEDIYRESHVKMEAESGVIPL